MTFGPLASFFDKDGILYTNTFFGDFLHFIDGKFTGWMLLSYNKLCWPLPSLQDIHLILRLMKISVSIGVLGRMMLLSGSGLNRAWNSKSMLCRKYTGQDTRVIGRVDSLYYFYLIGGSLDGKDWFAIVDKRSN